MEKKYINYIIVYIIILLVQGKRYIWLLPTFPFYPNNEKEIQKVLSKVNFRTFSNIEFFKLTDPSVTYAFEPLVEESIKDLQKIILNVRVTSTIKFLKYFYNRARPHQIDSNIKPLKSTTARTPSYPAGHAFQAYYLAKTLSKKYPQRKNEFYKIAKQCDDVRIIAGLHYPSDGEFAKKIVEKYF
jgi:hypothetical protein